MSNNDTSSVPWIVVALLALGATLAALFEVETYVPIAVACLIGVVIMYLKPEYGIIVFLTTFFLYYPEVLKGVGKITPNNLLGTMFSFLLFQQWFQKRDLWFLKLPHIHLLAGIGIIFLTSAWFAPSAPRLVAGFDRSQKELWDFFTQFTFIIFMIHFIQTRKHLMLLFSVLLLLIMLTAPSVFYSGITAGGSDDYRATASFGIQAAKNSNRLAFFCIFGLTCFWYLRQQTASPFIKHWSLPVMGVFLVVILLSGSRSAVVNLIVLGLVIAREVGVDPRKMLTTILVAGIMVFIAISIVPQQHLSRMTSFGNDPTQREATKSIDERISNIKAAIHFVSISNPLLGVGPGNFRWMRHLYYDHKHIATHNGYLWALVTGGVGALALYLTLFWVTWKDLRWLEHQRLTEEGPPLWLVKAVKTTFVLFLVFSMFAEIWLEILVFLLIGMTIVMKRLHMMASEMRGQAA